MIKFPRLHRTVCPNCSQPPIFQEDCKKCSSREFSEC